MYGLSLPIAVASLLLWIASPVSAQVDVFDEETDEICSTVTLEGHSVEGGCHVEYRSEGHISLVAYAPTPVEVFSCDWHLEAQIGGDGSGYVTAAELTTEPGGTEPPCTRAPCDEATHEMIPWPIQVSQGTGPVVELEVCMRNVANEEGGTPARCELHLPLTVRGTHNHEIGNGGDYFCEESPLPPLPIAFQNLHLTPEIDAEESSEDVYFDGLSHALPYVLDEQTGDPCPPVSLEDHVVEGGCHVEYRSEEDTYLVVYIPNPTVIFACTWHLEARIGEDGSGYVSDATLGNSIPPTIPGCEREPCDEPNDGAMLPWPIQIVEAAPSDERVELDFCLRPSSQSGVGGWCEMHMPFVAGPTHDDQAIGAHDEYFCEVSPSPPAPVSFRDVRFIREGGESDGQGIELVH